MQTNAPVPYDITRTTLAVLFICMLIAASFWILLAFLTSMLWATMIVIATWPLLLGIQRRLFGKRGLAVAVMTVVLLLVLIVPLSLAVSSILERSDDIANGVKSLATFTVPPPPDWLKSIPLIGKKLVSLWQNVAAMSAEEISAQVTPYAGKAVKWFVAQAGSFGMMLVQFLLTVIISAIMYSNGETAAAGIRKFAFRLAGRQGEEAVILAGKAVRGVALGVVVTAIIQSVLGAIGLAVSGIPGAALLTGVMFMLCVAQLGPALVLFPSVIWLYWSGDNLWGTLLLIWSLFVGFIDNFIRPVLIKKGADLPLLLIFAGVIGGLIAFGIVGLFIGPVVLAVTYTLLKTWVTGGDAAEQEVSEGS